MWTQVVCFIHEDCTVKSNMISTNIYAILSKELEHASGGCIRSYGYRPAECCLSPKGYYNCKNKEIFLLINFKVIGRMIVLRRPCGSLCRYAKTETAAVL